MSFTRQKKVFIGSSVEGIPVMEALHAQFEYDKDIKTYPWTLINFAISKSTLDSLEEFLDEYDYAVLIFTPDDYISKRNAGKPAPRDNVLFEFGLFLGRFGRQKTFVVRPRERELHIPTDLKGLTPAEYEESDDPEELKVNLSFTARKIKAAIEKNERNKVSQAQKYFDQNLENTKEQFRNAKLSSEKMDVVLGALRNLLTEKSVVMDLSLDDILSDIMLFTSCFLDFLDIEQLPIHQHSDLSEVWVYAPKPLELYEPSKSLRMQVHRNILNGVNYLYFVDSKKGAEDIRNLSTSMSQEYGKPRLLKKLFKANVKIVMLKPEFFLSYFTIHISNGNPIEVIQSVLTKQRKDILVRLPDNRAKHIHSMIDKLVKNCVSRNVDGIELLELQD